MRQNQGPKNTNEHPRRKEPNRKNDGKSRSNVSRANRAETAENDKVKSKSSDSADTYNNDDSSKFVLDSHVHPSLISFTPNNAKPLKKPTPILTANGTELELKCLISSNYGANILFAAEYSRR